MVLTNICDLFLCFQDALLTHVARGLTPAVWAAGCGHLEGVKALLEGQEGGEGRDGYQPLHAAASVGAQGVCEWLLEAGLCVVGGMLDQVPSNVL